MSVNSHFLSQSWNYRHVVSYLNALSDYCDSVLNMVISWNCHHVLSNLLTSWNSHPLQNPVESCPFSRLEHKNGLGQLEGRVDAVVNWKPFQLKRSFHDLLGNVSQEGPEVTELYKHIEEGQLDSWVVSHLAPNFGTLCHALACEFEPWWQQTLFQTQTQHLCFLRDSI